ncbi:MAG: hypothetical protein PF572_02440 [Patescibacteria group bacterium]|jgi:hypothetical protein|nr:hypothetical protein [Patescibacteria group bacterium]
MDSSIKKNIEIIQSGATKKGNFNFKDTHVFTMPKGYKKSSAHVEGEADNAKKTGFIILIFGSLFLILSLAGSYYYFIMKGDGANVANPSIVINEEQSNKTNTETNIATQDKVNDEVREGDLGQKVKAPEKTNNQIKENTPDTATVNSEKKREVIAEEIEGAVAQEKEVENLIDQDSDIDSEEMISEEQEVPTPTIILTDYDKDGLSKEEEIAAGTSDSSPDTDSDTYADLAEMLNGYNPLGEGEISDNLNFKKFTNSKYQFSFYHPVSFTVTANTNDAIILDLGEEQFFQIFIEANEKKLSIEDWYKSQFGVNVIDSNLGFAKGSWRAIKNADSKAIFFKNNIDNYVIALNYSSNDNNKYLNIFEIVFNTFTVLN